jgi:hypothetical protein
MSASQRGQTFVCVKNAKALGLHILPTLPARADEVIEQADVA